LLILEAARRAMGYIVLVVIGMFLVYPSLSKYLPGILHGRGYSLGRLIGHLYMYEDGVFGAILKVIMTIVIPFILFGQFLEKLGAGTFFVDLAYSLMGKFRGGPAKIAVVATCLFHTGSATGNVATTGVITIPLMKKVGYKAHFAAAIEAVAASGGALCPPLMGATAFIMSEFTQIAYSDICIAAALPGFLYYLACFFQVDLNAATSGMRGLPKEELPSLKKTLAKGWHYLLPAIPLIYLLFILRYEPVTAAYASIVVLMVVTLFQKEGRLTFKKFMDVFESTSKHLLSQIGVMAGAGIIVAAVGLTGLGVRLSQMLVTVSGGDLLTLLVVTAGMNLIMCMGLPPPAAYILLAVMVAPALVKMGIPVLAAHMFIFYTCMWAHITPAVGPTTFVAASIAGANPYKVGWSTMRLGMVAYMVPFIFVYNRALFLEGHWAVVVLTVMFSALATYVLAAAIEGWFLARPANAWQRAILLVGGLAFFYGGGGYSVVANIIGFVAMGIAVLSFGFFSGAWPWHALKPEPSAQPGGVAGH
jgi:TRAP transporter 4TM/12TM fusion protein